MPILPGPDALGTYNPRPARGQPNYQVSPVGRALQGFGQELGSLGATIMQDEAQRKAELDKTEAFGVQSRLTEFATNWTKQFDERKASVEPGAAGFSDKFTTDYTQSAREFMGTVPVPLRQQVDVKLGSILQSFTPDAQAFQRGESFRYGQEKVADGLNEKLTRLSRDPTQWPQIEKEGIDLINSNPAYSPVQRDEAIRKWTNDQQIARFEINKTLNGAGEADKLGVTPGGNVGSTGFLGAIARAEGTAGRGDYNTVLGYGQYGSPRKPLTDMTLAEAYAFGREVKDKQGKSSALGRYQIVGTTMREFADRLGLDWNTTKFDAATQDALATEIAKVQGLGAWEGFKSHPGEKDIARQYLSAGGGDTSALDAKVAAANKGMNQGQGPTLDAAARRTIVEPDPGYAKIDYFTRVKMYDDAIKTDQKEFAQKVDDYSSYLRSGGQPQEGFDVGTLQQRLGPEVGQKAAAQLQESAGYGQTMTAIKMAPPAQVQQIVQQAQDMLSSPDNFQVHAQEAAGIMKAVDDRQKELAADPAGYVMKNSPEVASAWEGVQPGSPGYDVALRQTTQAQASLGLPPDRQEPLPKQFATAAATRFNNVDVPEGDRLAALTTPVLSTNNREQQQAVFHQLVKAGVPEMAQGALEAYARGDEGAAQRLMRAVMVDPSKIGKIQASDNVIRNKIQSDIMNEGQIGDVAYGLTLGDASNFELAKRNSDLLFRAIQMRLAQGQEIDAATEGAQKDLFGDRQVYTYDGDLVRASMLFPPGTNTDSVASGLESVLPQFRAAAEATAAAINTSVVPASDGSRAVVEAALANSVSRIMDTGVFRNVAGGVGLFDPYSGLFVIGPDGKPFTVPLEQVTRAGVATPDTIEKRSVQKQVEQLFSTPSPEGGF